MSRLEINRSGEMEIFVRVVELGGFSAAARASRMTPSAVSKLVGRLEARLGARLFNRSTRKLALTAEGQAFHDRSVLILAEIDAAEAAAAEGESPRGRVRINTSASYGVHVLAPLLPDFMARHPFVTLDLVFTDAVVDLMEAQADIAVRAGPLASSSLIARKLGTSPMAIVAAPAYLDRHGHPATVAELERHVRLGFGYSRTVDGWPLVDEAGRDVRLPGSGALEASDGEALRHLALSGAGLARLALFTVRTDIAAGRLVHVLPGCNGDDAESFHAVYLGQGGLMPARIRAMLDFLAERGRVG